jgi:cyclase
LLRKRLIPSLLLRRGRLVKGTAFRDYRDAGRAETTARAHNAQGADEIVILDIDASREGRAPDFAAMRSVAAECFMPVTFGGGIRSRDDAARAMDAGADKLTVTTTALDNPGLIDDLAHLFGAQAIVLGVDVWRHDGVPLIYDFRTDAPRRDRTLMAWIKEGIDRGAGEIRIVSANREGRRVGMDLELVGEVTARFKVPVIAEGGAGTLEHLAEALERGADGVAVGTMLVFSDNNLVKIKRFLRARGCAMRE